MFMKNLIPFFIAENYSKREFEGSFQGVSFFVDVSGFTSITNALMKKDKEGAEIMSDILNGIFDPAVNYIYSNRGFVSHFAGDAFVAIFPYDKNNRINVIKASLSSALKIRNLFIEKGKYFTKFGFFELFVKIGISAGNIEWGIINNPKQNAYYFKGASIDGSADCEKHCFRNSVVFDKSLISNDEITGVQYKKTRNNFYKLLSLAFHADHKGFIRSINYSVQNKFYDESVIKKSSHGEFREAVSCFISFESGENINEIISRLIDCVHEYGGYFNNINFGDKGAFALVFFGIPVTKEGFVEKAGDFLLSLKNIKEFEFKAGATFGKVFAGFRGSRKRSEYVCLGSAVNLAARLMASSQRGKIFTDKTFKNLTDKNYNLKYVSAISLKGFSKKTHAFQLQSKKSKPCSESYLSSFVGREKELQILMKGLKNLELGNKAGILAIIGEAGIGKSRLVNEFRNKIKNTTSLFLFQPDKTLRTSLNPFISNLKRLIINEELPDKTAKKAAIEKFFSSIKEEVTKPPSQKKEAPQKLTLFKSVIADLLGMPLSEYENTNLDPSTHYENTIEALSFVYYSLSVLNPSVMIFEDFHNFDEDSIYALSNIVKRISKNPSLIVISVRPEEKRWNEFKKNINISEIILNKLDESSQNHLVKNILGNEIEDDIIATINNNSSGNPLYLEYLSLTVSDLIHGGKFNGKGDILRHLPASLNEIIYSRFDSLKKHLKESAIIAAVLGNEFEDKFLKMLMPNKKNWKEVLKEGERENLWIKSSDKTHRFCHALVQESIYDMQSRRKLEKIHLKAGHEIEKAVGKNPGYHPVLAYHFENGQNMWKASFYLQASAEKAEANYENSNAIDYYTRLLEAVKAPEKKNRTNMKIAKILFNTGKTEEAERLYKNTLKKLKKTGNIDLLAECHKELGVINAKKSYYREAVRRYSSADRLYSLINDKISRGRILLNTGNMYLRKREYARAEEIYRKYIEFISALDDAYGISAAFEGIAWTFFYREQYEKSLTFFNKSLHLCRKMKDKARIARIQSNIGTVYLQTGKLNEAERLLLKSVKNFELTGNKSDIVLCINSLASISMKKKHFDKSIELFEQIFEICDEIRDAYLKCDIIFNTGLAYYFSGKFQKALVFLRKQIKIAQYIDSPFCIHRGIKNIARVYEKTGEYTKALKGYKKCLSYSKKWDDMKTQAIDINNIGEIYLYLNELQKADIFLQKAENIAKSIGFKRQLCIIFKNRAKVFFSVSRIEEAKKYNAMSRDIAQDIGKIDVLFETSLLNVKITAIENKDMAQIMLDEMLKFDYDENQIAEIKAEIYKLIGKEEFKFEAIKTYKELFIKNSNPFYLKKIEEINK